MLSTATCCVESVESPLRQHHMLCLSFGPITPTHSPLSPIIQVAYGFLHIL